MLAIVEDQQRAFALELRDQAFAGIPIRLDADVRGTSDRRRNEISVAQRRKIDEPAAVRITFQKVCRDLQRDARFPMPPEPMIVRRRCFARRAAISATSRSRPTNEVTWSGRLFGVTSSGAKRRKRLVEVRRDELVDLLGSSEILETVRAEVAQRRLRRHLAEHEIAGNAGDQNLSAVADSEQARDAVERWAEIVAAAFVGVAGIEAPCGPASRARRNLPRRAPAGLRARQPPRPARG